MKLNQLLLKKNKIKYKTWIKKSRTSTFPTFSECLKIGTHSNILVDGVSFSLAKNGTAVPLPNKVQLWRKKILKKNSQNNNNIIR